MLKAGFFGSGKFAAVCLRLLYEQFRPTWVLTNSPKASGRGLELHKTAVHEAAVELELPCFTTERLSTDTQRIEWLKNDAPDIIFVIDFGQLIKEPVLSLPRLGCINIHPSRLPMYRGSSPLQRALLDGLKSTAVSIFRLDAGMDTGDILAQPEMPIADDETYDSLLLKAAHIGTYELINWLKTPESDWKFTPQSQDGVSYAPKIEKAEGRIDWTQSAFVNACKIRALSNAPGVFCFNGQKRLRIFEAKIVQTDKIYEPGLIIDLQKGLPVVACGENALLLLSVQPDGKRRQNAADWLRGARLNARDKLL